jgi:sigma-B regulation protein RsbU (phosphoserine phosphatase)
MEILLAEDLPLQLRAVQSLLTRMGHSVRTAENGTRAVELLADFPPQLIISDWEMPGGLDGIELCKHVRATNTRDYIYFIMLTARNDRGDLEVAMAAGVDDFICKQNITKDLPLRLFVAERILGFRNQFIRMSELIPMCSVCHKVRQDRDYWTKVETFIEKSLHKNVTHGMCPECLAAATAKDRRIRGG